VDGNATISSAAGSLYLEDNNYTSGQKVFGVTSKSGDLFLRSFTDDKLTATNRFGIDHSTGDISFYEDTGTTAKFFWDASAESLTVEGFIETPYVSLGSTTNSYQTVTGSSDGNDLTYRAYQNHIFKNTTGASSSTDGTERMRIDSSGNVGIGTSSPTGKLTVDGGSIHLGNNGEGVVFGSDTNTNNAIFGNASSNFIALQTAGSERMRIDSSGSVGIGCTPDSTISLDVQNLSASSNNVLLRIKNATNLEDAGLIIEGQNGGAREYRIGVNTIANSPDLTFSGPTGYRYYVGGSERMRIDSSGNLLVGQSSSTAVGAGNTTTGFSIRNDGGLYVSRTSGKTATFNRNTSDGEIAEFRKDGTTVGSIGTNSNALVIHPTISIGTGLWMDANHIEPTQNDGTRTNGTRDFGSSSYRWKDLYLSGGVYLGGTGSANHLDDYEEGTFTPTLVATGTAFSGVTHGTQTGAYTKIGNQVTVRGRINASVVVGGSGSLAIGNMPFTASREVAASVGYISGLNFDDATYTQINLYMSASGGGRLIFTASGDNNTAIEVPTSNFTSSFDCAFTATYVV
jgi:hypothetical protein